MRVGAGIFGKGKRGGIVGKDSVEQWGLSRVRADGSTQVKKTREAHHLAQ